VTAVDRAIRSFARMLEAAGFENELAVADDIEVYVACLHCDMIVTAIGGRACGLCGCEVADKAAEHLYLLSS
jgi:hypothetical protein